MMEASSLRIKVDDLKRDLASSKETHHVTVHALTRFVQLISVANTVESVSRGGCAQGDVCPVGMCPGGTAHAPLFIFSC